MVVLTPSLSSDVVEACCPLSPHSDLPGHIIMCGLHFCYNKFSLNSNTGTTGSVSVLPKNLQSKLSCLLKFSADLGSSVQCVPGDECLILAQLYFSALQIPRSSEWLLIIRATSDLYNPPDLLRHWPSKTESNNTVTSERCVNSNSSFSQQNLSALALLPMSGENGPIQHWTINKITQLFELLAIFIYRNLQCKCLQ